jgi:hypothetical protein
VLVIVGQTFDLPADVRAGIAAFQQAGGTVITAARQAAGQHRKTTWRIRQVRPSRRIATLHEG